MRFLINGLVKLIESVKAEFANNPTTEKPPQKLLEEEEDFDYGTNGIHDLINLNRPYIESRGPYKK